MKKLKTTFLLLALIMNCSGLQVFAQHKLRVISYNILEGMKNDTTKGKQVFVNWVKSYAPDILALQECNKFTQLSLEEMAARYGHPYAILVKTTGYPVGITSKYPIVDVQKITDNMTHGFIVCKIKDLNVIVLHLNPHKYRKRREEIGEILGTMAVAPVRERWMIMGDFNSFSPLDKDNYQDGDALKSLQEAAKKYSYHDNLVDGKSLDFQVQQQILDFGLKDAGKIVEPGSIPKRRIDYIYVSKDLIKKVTTAHFIRDDFTAGYSDHKPVIMEFKHTN
ncbi:exodeoxyribonuclease-3 [Pedobacter sp. AK017]|uniref:endonuclease/exonuclease/phosphatase family protein n=1 Tax=Pedobacter sp. AK017 TaxID=2723073 RepID=UPI00161D30DF|nr:endonuclease/exonuclease/phosphatase family protein [Pedobacter sp. AK017]MBB5436889.1 exodeoxyribonuclease-3 [Pedobacter sp. AK017]